MNNEPKISSVGIFFLLIISIIADLLNWIPILGQIISLCTFIGLQLYFKIRGIPAGYSLVGNMMEFIPFVNFLPFLTFSTILTIYQDKRQARLNKK